MSKFNGYGAVFAIWLLVVAFSIHLVGASGLMAAFFGAMLWRYQLKK